MVGLTGELAMRARDILMSWRQGFDYSLSTQTCVVYFGLPGRNRSARLRQENDKNASFAGAAPHASDFDRSLPHAHLEHGAQAVARHLHAAVDARYRHIHLRFHAGDRRAKSRLGISAALSGRADGP